MSEAVETSERAIVFEDTSGDRKQAALACVTGWLSELDDSLLQVDLGVREEGAVLFVILRLREDRFGERAQATVSAAAERARAQVIALSELEYQDRGSFLTRFAGCTEQRLGLAPDEVPAMLEVLLARLSRVEQRRAPRQAVQVPVVTTGAQSSSGMVENLSAVGALARLTPVPVAKETVDVELKLAEGSVRAQATVLEVSARGVVLDFTQPLATLKPAERVGDYELISLLGSGGTGEVHLARGVEGPNKGQQVALKRLHKRRAQDAEAVRHFEAEAKTHSRLKHPHIVRTLEAGVVDGQQFLVMELIEGNDLGQILRKARAKKKQLPVEVACYLGMVLLGALQAVHDAKDEHGAPLELVHGDVSPHNLFVSGTGLVKLGDFGLTRRAGAEAEVLKRARPTYVSPEALDGEVSQAMDLWAAAVTIYELLTLEQPFTGDTLEALTTNIRKGRELPLRDRRDDCSGPLEALLRTALEKDQGLRFQSAKFFAAALAPHFHPVRAPRLLPTVVRDLFPR